MKQNIVLIDLETSPNLGYTWGVWEQTVINVKVPWQLLSFAYKRLDNKKITCVTRKDFKDSTDKSLTKALWQVMNDADILIAHNLNAFDLKKSNAKFLEHGLTPPKPAHSIDTLKVARKHFKLNSNRLNDLGKLLGVGQKVQHSGFQLWLDVMANVREGWRTMIRYNKQDVLLLQAVYLKLLPWIDNHPRSSAHPKSCPNCSGTKFQSRGTTISKTCEYQRFLCKTCGRWLRNRIAEKTDKPKYVSIN